MPDDSNLRALADAKAAAAQQRAEVAEARAAFEERDARPESDFLAIISPETPFLTAQRLCELRDRRLLCYAGDFYEWRVSHYARLNVDDMRAEIYHFLDRCGQVRMTKRGPIAVKFEATKARVDVIIDALRGITHVSSELTPPCWLTGTGKTEGVLSCANGLVNIISGAVMPHTAEYFNVSATDFAYDSAGAEPSEWLTFMKQLWPNDQESINTLQEMFGYVLSGDMRQQKMFLMLGPPRCGKGTISRILIKLMGGRAHASTPLGTFSNDFGLQQLLGKSLALIPDARLSGHAHTAVERLLAISGQDSLDVNRKFMTALNGVRLGVRFLFLTNLLPKLIDPSGAIASRFIVFLMSVSFLGREDLELEGRLTQELPAILRWSIEGYKRLQARGRFIQPKSGAEKATKLAHLASPMTQFIEENYDLDPAKSVATADFYLHFCQWWRATSQQGEPGSETAVGMMLGDAFPQISRTRMMQHGVRSYRYVGLAPAEEEQSSAPQQGKLQYRRDAEISDFGPG